jgi:hypothetical protein
MGIDDGIGDFFSGLFGSKNKTKAQAPKVDPNAYQYGGREGGADQAADRYRAMGLAAGSRHAAQADFSGAQPNYSQADIDRNMGLHARSQLGEVGNMQLARAMGRTPSIAGQQSAEDIRRLQQGAQRQGQQAQAAQMSASASARGPAGLALAQQGAANNIANAHGAIGRSTADATTSISNQAQINAANERLAAENAAANTFGAMRGQDLTSQGQSAQQTQFNAGLNTQQQQFNAGLRQQQSGLNDAMLMGMTQNEMAVRNAQLTASMNQQAQTSANALGATTINAGVAGQNASTNQQNALGFIGGVGQVVGQMEKGGPVKGGAPYLVGEKGPEIIVPPRDGVVIPNHALPKRMGEDYGHRTAQYSMDAALAEKEEERRNMAKTSQRDTPADQRRVGLKYDEDLKKQADAFIAGMKASQNQGASVAIDQGDVDQPAPAGWLTDYIVSQNEDKRLAMRERGGPLKKGQPAVVGEAGKEAFVPSTWGTGRGVTPEDVARQQWEGTKAYNLEEAGDRDRDARLPMSTAMAVPGLSPGVRDPNDPNKYMTGAEPLQRRDRETVDLAKAKEAEGIELTDDEQRKVGGAKYRLGGEKKAAQKGVLSSALGDMGKQYQDQAAHVDTTYHGTGGYVSPHLLSLPARQYGGPVTGGQPTYVGERGAEVVVPQYGSGANPWANLGAKTDETSVLAPGGGMNVMGYYAQANNSIADMMKQKSGSSGPQMRVSTNPGAMPKREEGGPVKAGQKVLVGEKGVEAVVEKPIAFWASREGVSPETTERHGEDVAPGVRGQLPPPPLREDIDVPDPEDDALAGYVAPDRPESLPPPKPPPIAATAPAPRQMVSFQRDGAPAQPAAQATIGDLLASMMSSKSTGIAKASPKRKR